MNEEKKTAAVPQGIPPVAPDKPAQVPAAQPAASDAKAGPAAAAEPPSGAQQGEHPARQGGSSKSRRRRRKRSRAKNRAAQAHGETGASPQPSGKPAKPVLPPVSDMPQPAAMAPKDPPSASPEPSAAPQQNPASPQPAPEPAAPDSPSEEAANQSPPAWPVEQKPAEKTAGPSAEESTPPADLPEEPEPPTAPESPEPPEEPEAAAQAPDSAEGEESAEPELDAAEQARRAEISRTAQMSIQQILSGLDQAESSAPAEEEPAEPEAEELPLPVRLKNWALGLLSGMARWLLLVVLFIALIAGIGLAWLYSQATRDMIPEITVSFDGQTLETASYAWHVPVVGNQIKRTYSDTVSREPEELDQVVDTSRPTLSVSPSGFNSQLTITDADGTQVFSGTVIAFRNFSFAENGEYTATLTLSTDQGGAQNAAVTGSQTYLFQFTVGIRPTMRITSRSAQQGSVVAVWVTGTQTDETPTMTGSLEGTDFVRWEDGWVAFLGIPLDTKPGGYTVTVTADGYTDQLDLSVTQANYGFRDVSSNRQRANPYIGPEDTPSQVQALLDEADTEPAWTDSGFVQPFLRSVGTVLAYGAPEYVGRNSTERAANIDNGTARIAENTLVETRRGDSMISPADGRVLLAENLGGEAGNTIVIDHGAGIRSIFYNLGTLQVSAGDKVVQGQTIATTLDRTIVEVRVGQVAVEPLSLLRGECDALNLS